MPFSRVAGRHLVIEEKMDGAVTERYKFVRADFLTSVSDMCGH